MVQIYLYVARHVNLDLLVPVATAIYNSVQSQVSHKGVTNLGVGYFSMQSRMTTVLSDGWEGSHRVQLIQLDDHAGPQPSSTLLSIKQRELGPGAGFTRLVTPL